MKDELLWEKVLRRIKEEVNSLAYATWFEPTKLKIVDDNKYVIMVPTEIHQRRLEDNYLEVITNNLYKETKELEELSFAIDDELEEDLDYIPRHGIIQ